MQWHPIFAHLLRPLLEDYYEVRTNQPIGDLPRTSDIVLLRKSSTSPPPFLGLWSRLTPWNLLEYKGPTVSARFDELHDLLELGLGIHRRLNEQQRKSNLAKLNCAETSFWYLVNHLGQRFRRRMAAYLPGIQQQADGIWQTRLYRHPVFLVSVQELKLDRDSLPLHMLAGVPQEEKGTAADVLKAEPKLWPSYGSWLATHELAIWQEICLMAAQQGQKIPLDFGPLVKHLIETGDLKRFIESAGVKQTVEAVVESAGVKQTVEAVGVKQAIEAVGVKQTVEAVGLEHLLEGMSTQQREELRRLLNQQGNPGGSSEST